MFRPISLVALTSLIMLGGCADVVEFADRAIEPVEQRKRDDTADQVDQPRRVNHVAREDASRQRGRANVGHEGRAPSSDTEEQDDSRSMPSNDMPSRNSGWGRERQMPSDTMPSETMPSRTAKWGTDREMPSGNGKWGKGRSMPSDSAFRGKSKDQSDSDVSNKATEEPTE